MKVKTAPSNEVHYFQTECKDFKKSDSGVIIKGYASTPEVDRQGDTVLPEAFQKSINSYMENPVILRQHNPDRVVGKVLNGEDAPIVSASGLFITASILDEETAKMAEEGLFRTFSIGFIPKEVDYQMRGMGKYTPQGEELMREVRVIKDMDLVEISIVSTPANPKALFSVQKSLEGYFTTIPHTSMKCSIYTDTDAIGKIGNRWFSQKALDEMQLKNEPPAGTTIPVEAAVDTPAPTPIETPVETPIETPTETPSVETPPETVEQPKVEETVSEDATAKTVSLVKKAVIDELDVKAYEAGIDLLTKHIVSIQSENVELKKRLEAIENVLFKTPAPKGKATSDGTKNSFVSTLKEAKTNRGAIEL